MGDHHATFGLHMNTDSVEKKIEIRAPISRVWRALTDHAQFGQWFGVTLDAPFAVGKSSSGLITHCGHENQKWAAVVQKMEPERLFSLTWHPYAVDPNIDYSKETPTLVEFRLEATPVGTLLSVKESGFDQIPASRKAEALRKHDSGWAVQVAAIEAYVTKA
jgi:uncharacterized protein YndB with AHSA1/START domain